jgi:tRNA pseudouridine55 synthase
VARARRLLHTRDIGHAGTLDPLASGLMVLLIGEATKLSDYILNGDKSYRVKVKLGVRTDSLDITGQVLKLEDVNLDSEVVRQAALSQVGDFTWPVPLFSAVKKDGKKLYEYAHKNEKFEHEIPKRVMSFRDVQVLNIERDSVEAILTCSKGSYIRTWAAELGEKLGVGGTVEVLERTASHPYFLAHATTLENLEKLNFQIQTTSAFIPLSETLPGWKMVTVRGKDEKLLFNGQISHDLERRLILTVKESTIEQKNLGIKILSGDTGLLLAILEAQPNKGLKIRRVFRHN